MKQLSLEERYKAFCADAEELLEMSGFARSDQTPTIIGKAFYKACVALTSIHFPEDTEVNGIGPRGLIWGMYGAVEASNINKKDPDPVSGARSIAMTLKHIIKHRPPLDIEEGEMTMVRSEVEHSLCFVVMSFSTNPTLQDFYYRAIKPTIEKFGYHCERVDEQEFNGSIRNRILENIRKAKFIVADVTEARPNCYYELGVAHSLGKEVIHLAHSAKDVHFDVKDFNFILYARIDELIEKLRKRIKATVGRAGT
jgi:hypothetical protein